jgi:hypothetical protein
MMTSLKVWIPSCYFFSIVIYYLNFILNRRLCFIVLLTKFFYETFQNVLSEKDNLALEFVRNSLMNNTLVNINNEFLLQRQIRCFLEPERYLEDVVSIMSFILNNNTHATGLCIRKVIFLNKHRFSILT